MEFVYSSDLLHVVYKIQVLQLTLGNREKKETGQPNFKLAFKREEVDSLLLFWKKKLVEQMSRDNQPFFGT